MITDSKLLTLIRCIDQTIHEGNPNSKLLFLTSTVACTIVACIVTFAEKTTDCSFNDKSSRNSARGGLVIVYTVTQLGSNFTL